MSHPLVTFWFGGEHLHMPRTIAMQLSTSSAAALFVKKPRGFGLPYLGFGVWGLGCGVWGVGCRV